MPDSTNPPGGPALPPGTRNGERPPSARDLRNRQIAAAFVGGAGVPELARTYGYTDEGMRGLIKSDPMREIIEAHEAELLGAADRVYRRFLNHADNLAAGMINDAMSDSHPRQFDARKWVLDRIIQPRGGSANVADNANGVNVNVALSNEVANQLSGAVLAMAQAFQSGPVGNPDDHLKNAVEAYPPLSAEVTDVVPETVVGEVPEGTGPPEPEDED